MKAFICEVNQVGLHRLLPEEVLAGDGLAPYLRRQFPEPTTVAWALLRDEDAEAVLADVRDGRHGDACGTLLNRAVELISLGAALGSASTTP